jgi:hypothetical protein
MLVNPPHVSTTGKLALSWSERKQRRSVAIFLLSAMTMFFSESNVLAKNVESTATPMSKVKVEVEGGSLAKTTHTNVIPKTANHSDEPPFMNGEPEHISLGFDSDSSNDFAPESHRQLLVYPLASYAVLFKGKEKIQFDGQIQQLKKILATKSDHGIKEIPMLPPAEAFQVFHNHVKYLSFKQGTGVAFLTSYAQDEAPIENGNIFYTYQGISADRKYYVSLVYPIKALKLPKIASVKAGVDYVAKMSDDQFAPKLSEIDRLIQTISIK